MESFAELNLTPVIGCSFAGLVLSLGGDYLLWRGEMQENCKNTTLSNATAGFPQHNLDMLTGAGQYAC